MAAEPVDRAKLEYELRGTTLQVYAYMVQHGNPVGVREVQRGLGLSSPSVAFHHLDKLTHLGVVQKDEYGRYFVAQKVDVGVLHAFSRIGRFTLPRLAFYASFFTTLGVTYVLLFRGDANLYAAVFALGSAVAFWWETMRTWRRKPF